MMRKLLAWLLAASLLLAAAPVLAGANNDTVLPEDDFLKGQELVLKSAWLVAAENFEIDLAVSPCAAPPAGSVYRVTGEFDGRPYSVEWDGVTDTAGNLIFNVGNISPQEMGVGFTVTAQLCDGETVLQSGPTATYSVREYVEALYQGQPGWVAEQRTVYKKLGIALMNYGAAAQAWTARGEASVDECLTDSERELDLQKSDLTNALAIGSQTGYAAQWTAASLVISDTVTMRIKLRAAAGADPSGWTVALYNADGQKVGDLPLRALGDGVWCADCVLADPTAMADVFTFVVYDGSTPVSTSLRYSAESYVWDRFGSSDAKLVRLLKAMILYGRAVEDYLLFENGPERTSPYADLPMLLDYTANTTTVLNTDTNASVISLGGSFRPIDLTQYGYLTDPSKLALQFDIYFESADATLASIIRSGNYGTQMEICSGGIQDAEELHTANKLPWTNGQWVRTSVPLSVFNGPTGGTFDPTAWDFFRVYIIGVNNCSGAAATFKITNAQLIWAADADCRWLPLGGADAVWEKVQAADAAYTPDTPLVAGYDLSDYFPAGQADFDYATAINLLLGWVSAAGGGAVYIPAGVWPCYSEITVPTGCTLCGDWKVPDGHTTIGGTILAYYGDTAAEGNTTPFVSLSQSSKAQNLAFWYPEQTVSAPTAYPETLKLGATTSLVWSGVENITLINSWVGITAFSGAACPNMFHIYGTPLCDGIYVSAVQDIMRTEEIHFSPDYWLNSGRFTGSAAALRSYLRQNATALRFGRTDWSYLTDTYVDGYQRGLVYEHENAYGQGYNLHFDNCGTAIVGTRTSGCGEELTAVTVTNCDYGVYAPSDTANSILMLQEADIQASTAAVVTGSGSQTMLVNSTVNGKVDAAAGGKLLMTACTFSGTPQVKLGSSAKAVLTGNTGLASGNITNSGSGNLTFNTDAVSTVHIDISAAEQAAAARQTRSVANQAVTVARNLDATGRTDVSAALQAQLNALTAGGIFYLPAGHYRLAHGVIVPQGVELRGACDFAQMPYNTGTVLCVICQNEPAVTLAANSSGKAGCSGVRGITFFYPEQVAAEYYHGPKAYDYAVYAEDADFAYAVNVAAVNGYKGIGFVGCDDHFVDGFVGVTMNRGVYVADSARGIVRDVQFNGHSTTWGSFGWPADICVGGDAAIGGTAYTASQYYWEATQQDGVKFEMDNVTDEMFFGCFTYGGGTGLLVEGAASTVTAIGFATDYVSRSIVAAGGAQLDFINTQMTPFVYGDYTVNPVSNVYGVWLQSGFNGTVNMLGAELWQNPQTVLKVEHGTLNLSAANVTAGASGQGTSFIAPSSVKLFERGSGAAVSISAMFQPSANLQVSSGSVVNSAFMAKTWSGTTNVRTY